MPNKTKIQDRGFTFVELLAVIAILGILAYSIDRWKLYEPIFTIAFPHHPRSQLAKHKVKHTPVSASDFVNSLPSHMRKVFCGDDSQIKNCYQTNKMDCIKATNTLLASCTLSFYQHEIIKPLSMLAHDARKEKKALITACVGKQFHTQFQSTFLNNQPCISQTHKFHSSLKAFDKLATDPIPNQPSSPKSQLSNVITMTHSKSSQQTLNSLNRLSQPLLNSKHASQYKKALHRFTNALHNNNHKQIAEFWKQYQKNGSLPQNNTAIQTRDLNNIPLSDESLTNFLEQITDLLENSPPPPTPQQLEIEMQ